MSRAADTACLPAATRRGVILGSHHFSLKHCTGSTDSQQGKHKAASHRVHRHGNRGASASAQAAAGSANAAAGASSSSSSAAFSSSSSSAGQQASGRQVENRPFGPATFYQGTEEQPHAVFQYIKSKSHASVSPQTVDLPSSKPMAGAALPSGSHTAGTHSDNIPFGPYQGSPFTEIFPHPTLQAMKAERLATQSGTTAYTASTSSQGTSGRTQPARSMATGAVAASSTQHASLGGSPAGAANILFVTWIAFGDAGDAGFKTHNFHKVDMRWGLLHFSAPVPAAEGTCSALTSAAAACGPLSGCRGGERRHSAAGGAAACVGAQ